MVRTVAICSHYALSSPKREKKSDLQKRTVLRVKCSCVGKVQTVFDVKLRLGRSNMTLVCSQYSRKLECHQVNLPTGHPLTFPLFFCLMGLKLQEQFMETVSSWNFLQTGLQLCCRAGLELCSQLLQIKIWLQIHKLPARNQRRQNGSEITCR